MTTPVLDRYPPGAQLAPAELCTIRWPVAVRQTLQPAPLVHTSCDHVFTQQHDISESLVCMMVQLAIAAAISGRACSANR